MITIICNIGLIIVKENKDVKEDECSLKTHFDGTIVGFFGRNKLN